MCKLDCGVLCLSACSQWPKTHLFYMQWKHNSWYNIHDTLFKSKGTFTTWVLFVQAKISKHFQIEIGQYLMSLCHRLFHYWLSCSTFSICSNNNIMLCKWLFYIVFFHQEKYCNINLIVRSSYTSGSYCG